MWYEPRLLDKIACNTMEHPDCDVYPMTYPDPNSIFYLALNYILQIPILFVSAGAGFSGREEFGPVSSYTLMGLLQVDILVFLLPGLILLVLSFFPISARVGTFLIDKWVSNAAPFVYLLGIILFTVALLVE